MADQTELANSISELCLTFYNRLPNAKRLLKDTEWTIYSAIVMERESRLEVVSSGTGTKCIGSMMLSEYGDILNDSHAEVVCRRAFIRYLMSQVRATKVTGGQSIFKLDDETKKFKLDNVKVHDIESLRRCQHLSNK
jgi:tRNA-specific adenosine deaminase 1